MSEPAQKVGSDFYGVVMLDSHSTVVIYLQQTPHDSPLKPDSKIQEDTTEQLNVEHEISPDEKVRRWLFSSVDQCNESDVEPTEDSTIDPLVYPVAWKDDGSSCSEANCYPPITLSEYRKLSKKYKQVPGYDYDGFACPQLYTSSESSESSSVTKK